MSKRDPVKPPGIVPSPYFSPAVRMGQFLFISGQAAFDPQGNIVGVGNCGQQAEYVFHRIDTILQSVGASMDNVMKTTAFLTTSANYDAYNQVRSRYFPQDPPASTTVVTQLLHPDMLIEVEAIALLPG